MDRLKEYGFITDEYLFGFSDIFNDKNIKEIHIDIYSNEPYILFARAIEKNVASGLQDDRFVLRKKDGNRTVLTDIPLDNIENCMIKRYSDLHYQVVFMVQGICYKVLVII